VRRPDVHYPRNGDVSLAYQVVGEGPEDLMLVSGFSNIEYAWLYPSLARFLARLASFSRLILMDRCAQGIIEAVRALGFEIRAGVHTGEVEADGARVRGVAVHLGARIAAEARASQVLVSSTVRDLTAGSGLIFEDAGEHRLKGFEQPWQLYVASTSANPATAPADEHG
jgi:class 3 adenylate cyclase